MGQAYTLNLKSCEICGGIPISQGKISYSCCAATSEALDAIIYRFPNPDVVERQFIDWLSSGAGYYKACAAIYYAYDCRKHWQFGLSVGLLKLAIRQLKRIGTYNNKNGRVNVMSKNLERLVETIRNSWAKQNDMNTIQHVPQTTNTRNFICDL